MIHNLTSNLLTEPSRTMLSTSIEDSSLADTFTSSPVTLDNSSSSLISLEADNITFPLQELVSNGTFFPNSTTDLLDDYDEPNNCTNEYCISDEDYILMIEEHIFPTTYEWVLIALHSIVFVAGLVGNALVCVAVYRNHSMRTVTNYFIVNLAVADFMVILFCLPPTVIWDVTETWFMGNALCKIVPYFQTVSVAVSVLTLTFISVDRWYAICFPLKFKSTTGRAKTAIIIIWLLALSFDIPELIVLETERKMLKVETHLLTQCLPTWSISSETAFHVIKTMFLYTFPLIFMSVAYCQIVRVLWRSDNIPGHTETMKYHATSCNNALATSRRNTINTNANTTTEGQLRSRRKAAKMLVAVVVMFAVCYFPVHLLNILRYTMGIPSGHVTVAIAMLSHWLCYANSAVNPIIYNFMSGKFRKEFRRTFGWWRCLGSGGRQARARRRYGGTMSNAGSSTYICRFTTAGGSTNYTARTEVQPLSGVTSMSTIADVD